MGQLSTPRLMDWPGIYEEGIYWTLTVVAVTIGYELVYLASCVRLSLSDHYLEVHRILPMTGNLNARARSLQVIGWIEYWVNPGLRLEIGPLYRDGKAPRDD